MTSVNRFQLRFCIISSLLSDRFFTFAIGSPYMGEGKYELWCQMSSRSHDTGPGNQGTSASLDVLYCRGLNDQKEMLTLLSMM